MATRRSRTAKRPKFGRKTKTATDKLRGPRISLLYGLTGLFGVVVAGLILARPRPLEAQSPPGTDVVLMAAGEGRSGDAIDAALRTGDSAKPGHFTGVTVLTLTTSQARAAHAHFKVMLDGGSGDAPQVVVGPEWLQQTATPTDPSGQFVLVVVVDDHEREIRREATVVALVDRLCERLRIDPGTVKWS